MTQQITTGASVMTQMANPLPPSTGIPYVRHIRYYLLLFPSSSTACGQKGSRGWRKAFGTLYLHERAQEALGSRSAQLWPLCHLRSESVGKMTRAKLM